MGTISRYVGAEIRPRLGRIVFHPSFMISLVVGIAFYLYGYYASKIIFKVVDAGNTVLGYSAIALGFCVVGFALVVTIPNDNLARLIAGEKRPGAPSNSYSNLLFVFSWTAFLHWLLILISVAVLLINRDGEISLTPWTHTLPRAVVTILVFLLTYCLLQLLILILTLQQIGQIYITYLRGKK
jgi:hypothetical protein